MNVLSRPLVAVACLLFVLLAAMPALGQRFMPPEIVQAEAINQEANDRIVEAVEAPLFDMGRDEPKAEDVTEARTQLLRLLNPPQASKAYRVAISKAISSRMNDVVSHKSPMVRMNAMIVLGPMVDDGSKALIDKGISDDNDAVKRWAVAALGKRLIWWIEEESRNVRGAAEKVEDGIAQIQKLLMQAEPPHPIVVQAGLEALVKTNRPNAPKSLITKSRGALIAILNQRVALHAADPDLTYSPERSAIEGFTNLLVSEVPADFTSIKGYNRALSRYSALIVEQAKANQIAAEKEKGAHTMLFLSLQGMANVSAAAKAPKSPPTNHGQAKGWIVNGRWDELEGLIKKDWNAILVAAPIGLAPKELEIK